MSLSFCIMRHQEGYILFGFSPFENKDGGLLVSLLFCIMEPYEGEILLGFSPVENGNENLDEKALRCILISFFLHCGLRLCFSGFH